MNMLGCGCEIVRGSDFSPLSLVIWRALSLFFLVCVCPMCKTAVARLFADFGVELRVRVRHACETLVFGGFRALEHNELLVKCWEDVVDKHAQAQEELALPDRGLLL